MGCSYFVHQLLKVDLIWAAEMVEPLLQYWAAPLEDLVISYLCQPSLEQILACTPVLSEHPTSFFHPIPFDVFVLQKQLAVRHSSSSSLQLAFPSTGELSLAFRLSPLL